MSDFHCTYKWVKNIMKEIGLSGLNKIGVKKITKINQQIKDNCF
jgi:hypothetical protein